MGNLYFLITDVVILLLQLSCILCNGFSLFIFSRVKRLQRNPAIRMVLYLAVTDFMLAVTTLPYMVYLTAYWNNYRIILNPYMVMISSTPLVIQLKISLTLTIAIALERTIALYLPVLYRKMSLVIFASMSLLVGVIMACCDIITEFLLSPFLEQPNCAAIGCFVSDHFRYYWGASNMALGFLVITFTLAILIKLRYVQKNSAPGRSHGNNDMQRFKQANRSTVGVLIASLLFLTLPSVGAGIVEIIGFSIFKTVGPFYILGLLSSGTCNSLVYVALNRDMRKLAKSCLLGRGYATVATETMVSKPSSVIRY